MKKSVVLLIFTIFSLNLIAQKEATWWYFGKYAGISFTGTNNAPVNQTNGQMNNSEGVASISNSKGQLIFYTDGEYVYDRTHTLVNSGKRLKGHNSSTQSGVIVQQPGRGNRYWIFTVDEEWGNNGFQYAIYDTSTRKLVPNLDAGNSPSESCRLLCKSLNNKYAPEKVAAVKHSNKVDIWIINHTGGDNDFYVYKLSAKGLDAPIVQSIGPVWSMTGTGAKGYSKGYMKFSPDGTKLICAIAGQQYVGMGGYGNNSGRIEIYDFDNVTGKLSNAQIIDKNNINPSAGKISSVYGIEVSPNGRYLYASFYIPAWSISGSDGGDGLWQLDLLAGGGNADSIGKSCLRIVSSFSTYSGGGMQLAPDGRIYLARSGLGSGAKYLSCIQKPNCRGSDCSFVNNAIDISPRSSQWGVPTFINSFFNKAEFEWGSNAANLCEGQLTKLFITDSTGVDSAKWNFGDTASGSYNTAKGFTVFHKFSSAKTYSVFVQLYRKTTSPDCYADTARKKVTIFPNPKVNIGRDTSVCDGESIVMDATTTNATYIWSNSFTTPVNSASSKGWFWVDVKVGGCTTRDSLYLDVLQFPVISLGNDTLICEYDSIKLTANDGTKYLWSKGDTTSLIWAKDTGMVWLKASNGRCSTFDTLYIKHSKRPYLNIGQDSLLCIGDSLELSAKTQFSKSYLWNDNSTDSVLKVKASGIYWARIKDTLCYSNYDSANITFQTKLSFDIGKDTFICKGGSFVVNAAFSGIKTWKWHDNSTKSTYTATNAGKKWVNVTNGTCKASDTIEIFENTIPPFTLGNDTTLCKGETFNPLSSVLKDIEYTWMGISVTTTFPITNSGKYWVDLRDVPKKVCLFSDTINVTFKNATVINLGNDTSLCKNQTIDLNIAKYAFKKYKWWDGNTSTGVRKTTYSPGTTKYWVEGDDGVCKSSDTIKVTYRLPLSLNVGPDVNLCDNATKDFDLTGTPGATEYEWLSSVGLSLTNMPKYTVNTPGGTFIAKISDGYCPVYDTVKVLYKVTPIVNLGNDLDICDNVPNPVVLDASAAAAETYLWNTGSSSPTISVSAPDATYWVKTSNGNCQSGDTINVTFQYNPATNPIMDFGFSDSMFCNNPRISYDFTSPNTNYIWQDGNTSPKRQITEPGLYWLVASNKCGKDSFSVLITVDENGCRLMFPTAFSPNDDGTNDKWMPRGQVIEWVELLIINRWGEIIYKGDPSKGWDGKTSRGEMVPDGAYPTVISYRKDNGGYARMYVQKMLIHVIK
ncbi:MAG: gliding motility-associated C-terminal domain-containing protein [Bacteroidetes bacterium]|nr:gliding motility-associated C-terminal domain-containing protein [Bacteroidota bacterium]